MKQTNKQKRFNFILKGKKQLSLLLTIALFTMSIVSVQAQCPGFRTQTQGGWGAKPNGNNPGVYLHANFANAFPNGLVIGCGNTLTLTTAQAVTDFLPSGGPSKALTSSSVNPTSKKGAFTGNLTALTLSVGFDNYDANFGSSSYSLKDLIIQSGTFSGWTVQQLLVEANLALGGCASSYSRSTLNSAVDAINNNYTDGTQNGGFLGCPPSVDVTYISIDPSCALTADGSIDINISGGVSPYTYNWSNGATTEDLTNITTGVFNVTVTDANGTTGTESITLTAPAFVNPTITKVDNIGLDNDFQDTRATAFGDYDGDGYVDMFVPNYQIDSVSFLYHNNGDGTFTKVTDQSNPIVTDLGPSTSGVWGDYDNDGDIDLFVSNNIGFGNFLYRNEGNGTFVSIQNDPIVNYEGYSHGSAWADYDNDGFLDMFIADFFSTRFNKLYHNNGDGTFTEVESSPLVTDAGSSVSAVWGDYDNDKDQDLFVTNTNDENNFLYRNNGDGTFTKVTSGVVVNDGGKSTGASWADYDNDLDLDLFVSNAGGQSNFLYENNGDGTFTKITNSAITLNGGHSHGSTWGDMDNDGHIDLMVSNDQSENNNMFLNNGDGTFTALNNEVTQGAGKSFGIALADIDNDCDLDLHVSNIIDEANFMYLNNLSGCNKKVCFTLVGTSSNKLAYGAKVKILATIDGTPTWQMRELASLSGGGLGGQNDSKIMFGVGDAAQIDSVYVEWASGFVQKLGPVAVNTCLCTQIVEQNGAKVCGTVYFDDNTDCSYNGNDNGLEGIELVAQPGNIKAYTDEFGDYSFNLAPGVYTVTQTNTNVWTASCSTSYTINVVSIGQQYCGNDFANTTSCPNPDLYIDLSTTALRVGFENLYAITFGNNGAVDATNASIKVDFGSDIIPLSASLPWDNVTGTEYTWNIGTIAIGQEFTIYVEDSVAASATIGDNIAVLGTIEENGSTANDCDVTNNIETDINLAVGAIDPNDILVNPEGFIPVDQELTYRIRFQNVGNDLVNRVVLRDELPEGLDMSTLVRGVASHPYQFRIEGERTLVWEFNNINLLDSTTNEPESHGFVTFKITPQADLKDGTEIANKAAIFFDFADPIITNTVINTIGEPNDDVKPGDLAIYPNPMTSFTTFRIVPRQLELNEEEIQSIEIYTMLGRQVLSMNSLKGTRVMIEKGDLRQGYYVVKVISNKGTFYTGKLLVSE
ncbi:MAG: FG-GAP-like repeat-containing protein [Saprospiraceae bacterium]